MCRLDNRCEDGPAPQDAEGFFPGVEGELGIPIGDAIITYWYDVDGTCRPTALGHNGHRRDILLLFVVVWLVILQQLCRPSLHTSGWTDLWEDRVLVRCFPGNAIIQ